MARDTENLGPAASWHIRSIPESVRQAVVDKAHAERVSVGELLTRLVVGTGNAGDRPIDHPVDARATHVAPASHQSPSHAVAKVDARATDMVDAHATDAVDVLHATHRVDAVAHTVDAVAHAVDADRLLTLLQAADLLGKVELPNGALACARTMIGAELRLMRRGQRAVLGHAATEKEERLMLTDQPKGARDGREI